MIGVDGRPTRIGRLVRWLPMVPLAVGVVLFFVLADRGGDHEQTVDIHSSATAYQSLGALVAASDLIVVGQAITEAPGRAISAPNDPDASLVTHLIGVRIDEVIRGQPSGTLTVEEVVALPDGTPVRVDGQPATQVGERLLLFLVRGDPYVAVVNGQGRYTLSPTDQISGPSVVMPVDWTVDELRQVATACAAAGTC